MLISCKCLNITGYNKSVDEQVLKRTGSDSGQSLVDIAPGAEEVQGHELDGLAEFYYIYREFAKAAVGPIFELTETISQTDLAYEVPLKELAVKYCINCKTVTHVKNTLSLEYWINSKRLTTTEMINVVRENKMYSKVFGILMTSDSTVAKKSDSAISTSPGSSMSISVPTTPTTTNIPNVDIKNLQNLSKQQTYVKKLTHHLEEQLKQDYNEANERISRFIEQQAAILESNREKAKQEYQILVSLINRVPEELKVINNISTNTVNNNEDLGSAGRVVTKLTSNILSNQITNSDSNASNKVAAITQPLLMLKQNSQEQAQQQPQLATTSLDTPPATPDSTPMSVGNSPTFRQQTSIFGNNAVISGRHPMSNYSVVAGAAAKGGGGNAVDNDCIFDLDGMENYPVSVSNASQMSDVEETEDAEDALGELEGVSIQRTYSRYPSANIATSLPISIASGINKPRLNDFDDLDTELGEDRGVDIAASIKALARSVHGDTVFGDLPRPRLSTQI